MGENLSPRLGLLLGQGLPGEDFWDVCCDHGLLGERALFEERFSRVHFVDRVPHIMAKLRDRIGEPAGSRFILSGAEDLEENISGTVVIAGVGGFNLIKILGSWDSKKILHARRVVLNPLTHIQELRDFLSVWSAYSEKETLIVRESGRDRQILVLEPRV